MKLLFAIVLFISNPVSYAMKSRTRSYHQVEVLNVFLNPIFTRNFDIFHLISFLKSFLSFLFYSQVL